MFKTRLYLDFDGVVNADHPTFDDVEKFEVFINMGGGLARVLPVTFSPTLVSELDRLRKEYHLELVWLSTWNDNCEILRWTKRLGGLDGGRVLTCVLPRNAQTDREWTAWKGKALVADQKNDNTHFVWADDEAIKFHKNEVLDNTSPDFSRLLLEPRPYRGLTRLDLVAIENLLKNQ